MSAWFRRKPRGAGAEFKHTAAGERLGLCLEDGGRRIPVSDWRGARPDAGRAIDALQQAAEDDGDRAEGTCEIGEAEVVLSAAMVAGIDAVLAAQLALPPATNFALELRPHGLISSPDFCLSVSWLRPGGQPVRTELTGAILTSSDGVKRVPEPLWSLHRSALKLATPTEAAERFRLLAELRRHWPDDPNLPVESEAYLRDIRIHYASSASVQLGALTPNQTDFDPVLFGANNMREADDEGRPLDEELDSLLPPRAQRLFAEDRFRRERDVRPYYVLRDGEYVFIDPALRPVLGTIRTLQDRPESERRAFILNPRRVLQETLAAKDGAGPSENLDFLFVETEQFSSRVAGVDIWRAQVLPWLTPLGKNQWIPERFGLRVDDSYFVVPPENVRTLVDRTTDAWDRGDRTFDVDDLLEAPPGISEAPPRSLPLNDQTEEAIRALEPFAADAATPPPDIAAGSDDPAASWAKLFLVVRENFEEVEYSATADAAEAQTFKPIAAPARLRTELKPHQLEGLNWLAESASAGRPGGLLADDMGLGKTLQAIAFMAWLQDEASLGWRAGGPFLIIAPTALLGTWRDEIGKHLDGSGLGALVPAFGSNLKVLREESGLSARDIETGKAALSAEAWREAGVVLTTYETMRDYHFSFARTRFALVIYDEIQKLKNPTSQMTRAAKALNGAFTLGMTGTPVENRLQDLWSVMDVVAPGLLGASRDFETRHPADDPAALARLKAQMLDRSPGGPPYMLRRMKADALEGLPNKAIHPFSVDMPPGQANAYRDVIVKAAAAASAGTLGKGGMLSTLATMRGISLHPVDPSLAPADLDTYAAGSARLSKTLEILTEISNKGEKALIFVESLAMQDRLAGLIKDRFKLPEHPPRIHGGVPGLKRQALVTAFQQRRTGFDVMILSPKAGGVGLTLTAANHVIHLSRWWNPAVEDQATDRVFRIGQTRDVHVHLPMAVHPDPAIRETSFDLRLNALIERKRQLTRDLFLPPEPSEADLADLFREVSLGAEAPPPLEDAEAEAGAGAEAAAEVDTQPLPVAPPAAERGGRERPVLQLPKPLARSGILHWKVRPFEARPTTEIIELFRDRDISAITIRDPYALAHPNARRAQVEFVAQVRAVSRKVDSVTIEYAPEYEGDLPDGAARRDIGDLFTRMIPDPRPRLALDRRARRSRDDDFHDREIELAIRHAGGAVLNHVLSLGRGAEALFNDRWQCTVTYVPPSLEGGMTSTAI